MVKYTKIGGSRSSSFDFVKEAIEYLPIAVMFASKGVKSKYKESYLGPLWAILQPLVHMLVLNLFFGMVIRFSSGDVPYALHLLTGLVAFQLVTRSVNEGAGTLARSGGILSKIFLPRIIFPTSSYLIVCMDMVFPFLLLLIFLLFYGIYPTWRWFWLVPLFIWLSVLGVAALLFFSAICIRFHDVRMSIPIFTQLLFFGTPIFYPLAIVPVEFLPFYALNPTVGIVEVFRWLMLGYEVFPDTNLVISSLSVTIGCLVLSLITFGWIDKDFYKYV